MSWWRDSTRCGVFRQVKAQTSKRQCQSCRSVAPLRWCVRCRDASHFRGLIRHRIGSRKWRSCQRWCQACRSVWTRTRRAMETPLHCIRQCRTRSSAWLEECVSCAQVLLAARRRCHHDRRRPAWKATKLKLTRVRTHPCVLQSNILKSWWRCDVPGHEEVIE